MTKSSRNYSRPKDASTSEIAELPPGCDVVRHARPLRDLKGPHGPFFLLPLGICVGDSLWRSVVETGYKIDTASSSC